MRARGALEYSDFNVRFIRVGSAKNKISQRATLITLADYFDNPKDNDPSRSEIIVAENESDALHEARSKMGSLCSRAEVIPLEVTANPQSLAA